MFNCRPPEYNKNNNFSKQSKFYELIKKYDYDKMTVRKFELFNILKNKILICPNCSTIPHFDINLNIKISCYSHPNSIYLYNIDDFFYYFNELNSQICFYYGINNNNLLFDIVAAEESPYTSCKNCLNEYKTQLMKKYTRLITDRQNAKEINNYNNLCDDCLNPDRQNFRNYNLFNFNDYNYDNPNLKLENIFYSEKEIEELKSKTKIIESKINEYLKKNINDIRLNSEKEKYFKYLYFCLNMYNSFIYTYEYYKNNIFLNYRIISNLRKIKLIPNFNIDKKELFFINISMNRFLNGNINKKDNEILDLYDKLPYNYYINKIDVQTDGILYLKKKIFLFLL